MQANNARDVSAASVDLSTVRQNKYARPYVPGKADISLRAEVCLSLHAHPDWSERKVAKACRASLTTVRKMKRVVQSGSTLIDEKKRGAGANARKKYNEPLLRWLAHKIEQRPEAHLDELAQWMEQECGARVSKSTICRWLKQRLGLTRKRLSPVALQRDSAALQQRRETFAREIAQWQECPLVLFVDESAINSATRHYGRAAAGHKVVVAQPMPRNGSINIIAAVGVAAARRECPNRADHQQATACTQVEVTAAGRRGEATLQETTQHVLNSMHANATNANSDQAAASAPASPSPSACLELLLPVETVVGRTVNGVRFEQFVQDKLVPLLREHGGARVVMDNASIHKRRGGNVRQLIEQAGGHLHFLPPYSPDFNPIECVFGQVKKYLRRHCYWTHAKVGQAMRVDQVQQAFDEAVSVASMCNFIRHSGYPIPHV